MIQDNALAYKALSVARSQIGVREASGNNDGRGVAVYQEYVEHHNVHEPWCADFVSWCLYQAGLQSGIRPKLQKTASAPELYEQAKRLGLAIGRPEAGCLGFVEGAHGIEHVFFVTALTEQGLLTIEGNCDNQVKANIRHESGLLFCGVA